MVITVGANGLFTVTVVEDAIGVLACVDTFDAAHFNASRVTRITITLFAVHFAGCSYYGLAARNPHPEKT
ncbi:hypothetical protein BUALT_Bualt16G0052900 [Buddleja alternifolia]|uniref:Uncharacterized protein n=1 Tax=Buddleja alternifolia TaxID=168488 RepID=A0AAV6WHL6_9LAMI|nr:hypothetical protein BUALT_Bualt16G0052900 [Buddleja alternifolia]